MLPDILAIETAAYRAQPSLNTRFYDGWLLQLAHGYTRHANCVNPLYGSSLPLNNKISYCEAFYHDQWLSTLYKITPASQPSNLDQELELYGYERSSDVLVQTLSINSLPLFNRPEGLSVINRLTDEWLQAYLAWDNQPAHVIEFARQMRQRIAVPTGYAQFRHHDRLVAIGLGVVDGLLLGIYDIRVHPDWRRHHFGETLLKGLLQWAHVYGAKTAYLQVHADNHAALALYQTLNFKTFYPYWYRMKPYA